MNTPVKYCIHLPKCYLCPRFKCYPCARSHKGGVPRCPAPSPSLPRKIACCPLFVIPLKIAPGAAWHTRIVIPAHHPSSPRSLSPTPIGERGPRLGARASRPHPYPPVNRSPAAAVEPAQGRRHFHLLMWPSPCYSHSGPTPEVTANRASRMPLRAPPLRRRTARAPVPCRSRTTPPPNSPDRRPKPAGRPRPASR